MRRGIPIPTSNFALVMTPSLSRLVSLVVCPLPYAPGRTFGDELKQYLREDLAKHGLAVAGDTAPAPATAAAGNASNTGSAGQQRTASSSYKLPISAGTCSTPATSSSGSSVVGIGARGGSGSTGARYTQSVSPPPAPRASSASVTASRAAPGKLSASRFESFGRGSDSISPTRPRSEQQQQINKSASVKGTTAASAGITEVAGASAGISKKEGQSLSSSLSSSLSPPERRRWSVDPSSAPGLPSFLQEKSSSSTSGVVKAPAVGENTGSANPEKASPEKQGFQEAAATLEVTRPRQGRRSSVGGLAERFSGVKLNQGSDRSGGSSRLEAEGSAAAAVRGGSGAGNGELDGNASKRTAGGSGRIAELARRFEK